MSGGLVKVRITAPAKLGPRWLRPGDEAEVTPDELAALAAAGAVGQAPEVGSAATDAAPVLTMTQMLVTGGFRQLVMMQVAVGVVIRHYDGLMGGDRALQFDAFKTDLETALAGWEAPGSVDPFELVGGESSPVTTGVSICVQTWSTTRFLTGA